MPAGRLLVVTVKAGATLSVNALFAVAPLLSRTVTEILESPAWVGVPATTPAELTVIPGGVPVAVHVYPPLPPDAARV